MQPIIKDMPIPPLRRNGAKPKYPWRALQPGEAFKFNPEASIHGATSLAYQTGRQLGMKFAVRKMDDGIWCWRIDGTPYANVNGNYGPDAEIVRDYANEPAKLAQQTIVVGPDDDVI